jgi:hypothetical protein
LHAPKEIIDITHFVKKLHSIAIFAISQITQFSKNKNQNIDIEAQANTRLINRGMHINTTRFSAAYLGWGGLLLLVVVAARCSPRRPGTTPTPRWPDPDTLPPAR